MAVSLTSLRARVRERCDMTGSGFVSDTATSLDAFINASADELWDILIQKFGEDYAVTSSTLTTAAGTSSYALPADFYKLLGVDLSINGVSETLKKFNFSERSAYQSGSNYGAHFIRYRLEGNNLRLYPAPSGAYSGTIWYIPRRPQLVNAGDTLDGVNGWEEYVVVDAAIKCLLKEESDPSALMAAKADLLRRIESAAANRDAGQPERVVDLANEWRW